MKDRIAMSLVADNNQTASGTVIAAGPLTLQPHSRAYRIVIAQWGDDQLSVHQEIFDIDNQNDVTDLAEACKGAKSWLDSGDYFPMTELHKAQLRFAERLTRHASFVESVYRGRVAA